MKRSYKDRKPLPQIKCSDSKCDEGLHIYRAKRKKKGEEYVGVPCRNCGDNSVGWPEFKHRSLSDIGKTFAALRNEYVRDFFWTVPIDSYLFRETSEKGKKRLDSEIKIRLNRSVRKCGDEIFRDGTQTPLNKHNIIYFAQHATATCCRKCIQIWHNIPYDRDLTESEMTYLGEVIMAYIETRIPELKPTSQLSLFE